MKKYNFLILTIVLIYFQSSCVNEANLHFNLYPEVSGYHGSNNSGNSRYDETYLVSGYDKNETAETKIDIFACSRSDVIRDSLGLNEFTISFYKVSDKTNLSYLRKHPNYFHEGDFLSNDKGSLFNDFLWTYSFEKESGYVYRQKPKNYEGYVFYNNLSSCN